MCLSIISSILFDSLEIPFILLDYIFSDFHTRDVQRISQDIKIFCVNPDLSVSQIFIGSADIMLTWKLLLKAFEFKGCDCVCAALLTNFSGGQWYNLTQPTWGNGRVLCKVFLQDFSE